MERPLGNPIDDLSERVIKTLTRTYTDEFGQHTFNIKHANVRFFLTSPMIFDLELWANVTTVSGNSSMTIEDVRLGGWVFDEPRRGKVLLEKYFDDIQKAIGDYCFRKYKVITKFRKGKARYSGNRSLKDAFIEVHPLPRIPFYV